MESKNSPTMPQGSWSESEQEAILKTLVVVIEGQKAFGKEVSLDSVWEFYKLKLDGRFPADKVLGALDRYTDTHSDIPAPADLINIMEPPKPQITQAEYIHAQKQHAAEGFPAYGYYGVLIREYEAQQQEERRPPEEVTPAGLRLMHEAMKRLK